MKHNWNLKPPVPDEIVSALGFPRIQSQLLYNRGLKSRDEALSFLESDQSQVCDPFLLSDMDKAVSRIRRAIANGERIGVFGDFDIDGVSGTAVVVTGLRRLNAKVIPHIPNRNKAEEGHGLNSAAIHSLAGSGVTLLITVDCGSYDTKEVQLASSLGIDTIVTDHHAVLDLPPALAFISSNRPDSQYPFRSLAGVGMAYKLMQAVYSESGFDEPSELLEFVALGTVSDVVPLQGENRYFVREGLSRLNRTCVPGLSALIEVSGYKGRQLDTTALSFGLIPRLNAPGRLYDEHDARYMALNLMTTSDPENARYIAADMEVSNKRRQALTEVGAKQAQAQVLKRWGRTSLPGILMVGHRDWKPGIVGLIASKLVDMYHRPAIAVAVGESESRASARTVPGFSIFEPIEMKKELFVKFGGHSQAAGFTIPNQHLRTLADHFETFSAGRFDEVAQDVPLEIEMQAGPSLVSNDLFDFTRDLEPFGQSNPQPLFASDGLCVLNSTRVGSGRHLKMTVQDRDGSSWDAIAFRQGDHVSQARPGTYLEVAYSMELNTWRGSTSLQMVIEDLGPS